MLREELGDEEGAFGAIEIVLAESPDHADAIAQGESLARSLDRKPALVDILARRAELALGDDEAADALREAAALAERAAATKPRALELLQKLVQRTPSDRAATEQLVELAARPAATRPPTALIDALATFVDLVDAPDEKAKLLLETAALLDDEVDGKERAADCRERVLDLLPLDHAAGGDAGRGARRSCTAGRKTTPPRRAAAPSRPRRSMPTRRFRADALAKLLELRKAARRQRGRADRGARAAHAACSPTDAKWRDELLQRYLERSRSSRAPVR